MKYHILYSLKYCTLSEDKPCLFAQNGYLGIIFYSEHQSSWEVVTPVRYITYDDYEPQKPVVTSPFDYMKGHERVWDEEVMYISELVLEDPFPRNGSSALPLNMAPCGPTKRGNVYYSAFPGRTNLVRWKVIHPIVDGNCTIRLSNGLDESDELSYQVLDPVFDFSFENDDGSYDYYAGEIGNYYRKMYQGGKFSCGRTDAGEFESITVMFPEMTCDDCILQLIVETKEGNIYQCADIEIINSGMSECIGTCQNEGVCVNGQCLCRSGFRGDRY